MAIELFERMRARLFARGTVAKVDPTKLPAKPEEELARNALTILTRWTAPARSYNPDDDLIGIKGMEVYEKMRHDDQVKAALSFKKSAVLSTGWSVEPASDKKPDVEAADFVTWCLENLDPLYGSIDDIFYEQLSALDFGFSIAELVLRKLDDGPFKSKVGLKTVKVRKPHEFVFDTDEFDNLKPDGLRQSFSAEGYPIGKFLIFSYQREFGNFRGISDLRAAYRPWWLKDNLWSWTSTYAERFALPLRTAMFPAGTYPEGHPMRALIAAVHDALANLQANTAITLPNDFQIQFHEASGQGVNVLKFLFDHCNLAITRSILMPAQLGFSAETGVGSYAKSKTQFDAFMLVVDDLRRDLAEDVVNGQLIPRLVGWNFSGLDAMPKFDWLPFTEADEINLLNTWMLATQYGLVTPTPADETHIRASTKFPEREIPPAEEKAIKLKNDAAVKKIQDEADATLHPEKVWGAAGKGGGWGGWDVGGEGEGAAAGAEGAAGGETAVTFASARPFKPELHPRYPKGHPQGGQFKDVGHVLQVYGWTEMRHHPRAKGDERIFVNPTDTERLFVALKPDGSYQLRNGRQELFDEGKGPKQLARMLQDRYEWMRDIPEPADISRALWNYLQNSYLNINQALRGQAGWSNDDNRSMALTMAYGFEDPRVFKVADHDITVYRGIDNERVARQMRRLRRGQRIIDPAFLSTSTREAIASHVSDTGPGGVLMKITVPKGTRYLTGRQDEKELVLAHGSTLRVLRVSKSDDPSWGPVDVEARLVHRPGKAYADDDSVDDGSDGEAADAPVLYIALSPPYGEIDPATVPVLFAYAADPEFERKHPRGPKGTAAGGKFVPKGGIAAVESDNTVAMDLLSHVGREAGKPPEGFGGFGLAVQRGAKGEKPEVILLYHVPREVRHPDEYGGEATWRKEIDEWNAFDERVFTIVQALKREFPSHEFSISGDISGPGVRVWKRAPDSRVGPAFGTAYALDPGFERKHPRKPKGGPGGGQWMAAGTPMDDTTGVLPGPNRDARIAAALNSGGVARFEVQSLGTNERSVVTAGPQEKFLQAPPGNHFGVWDPVTDLFATGPIPRFDDKPGNGWGFHDAVINIFDWTLTDRVGQDFETLRDFCRFSILAEATPLRELVGADRGMFQGIVISPAYRAEDETLDRAYREVVSASRLLAAKTGATKATKILARWGDGTYSIGTVAEPPVPEDRARGWLRMPGGQRLGWRPQQWFTATDPDVRWTFAASPDFEQKHPRYPAGHPQAGRWRPTPESELRPLTDGQVEFAGRLWGTMHGPASQVFAPSTWRVSSGLLGPAGAVVAGTPDLTDRTAQRTEAGWATSAPAVQQLTDLLSEPWERWPQYARFTYVKDDEGARHLDIEPPVTSSPAEEQRAVAAATAWAQRAYGWPIDDLRVFWRHEVNLRASWRPQFAPRYAVDPEFEAQHPRDPQGRWADKPDQPSAPGGTSIVEEYALKLAAVADDRAEMQAVMDELQVPDALRDLLTPTILKYQRDDGTWDPARRAEQERWMQTLIDAYHQPPEERLAEERGDKPPTLFLLAGGAGSGKTTALNQLKKAGTDLGVIVSADDIKEKLMPEWPGLRSSPFWKAGGTVLHEESSAIAKELLARCIREKRDVVFDATLKSYENAERLFRFARANGYEIQLLYVDVDPAVAEIRSDIRAKGSGRWVPHNFLRRSHVMAPTAFRDYNELVDRWIVYRSTGLPDEPFVPPRRVATDGRKHTLAVEDASLWTELEHRAGGAIRPAATHSQQPLPPSSNGSDGTSPATSSARSSSTSPSGSAPTASPPTSATPHRYDDLELWDPDPEFERKHPRGVGGRWIPVTAPHDELDLFEDDAAPGVWARVGDRTAFIMRRAGETLRDAARRFLAALHEANKERPPVWTADFPIQIWSEPQPATAYVADPAFEAKHPRDPEGTPSGGKFRTKPSAAAPEASTPKSVDIGDLATAEGKAAFVNGLMATFGMTEAQATAQLGYIEAINARLAGPTRATPTDAQAAGTLPGKTFPGKCYEMAGKYILDRTGASDAADYRLVHGTVDQSPDGEVRIGHAWVETADGKVFDGTVQRWYERESFYRIYKAQAEQTYTVEEARAKMFETRNWGGWAETAGIVNDQRAGRRRPRRRRP